MQKSEDGHQHRYSYQAFLGVKGGAAFQKLLELFLRLLNPFHPNTVTLISVVFALIAAGLIIGGGGGLFLAAVFVWLNLIFDLLDGILARRKGLASRQGDYLDKCVDRLSDIILLTGIGFASRDNPYPAFICAMSLLLFAYLRLLQAQASAAGKYGYQTFVGRAGLLVSLCLALIIQGVAAWWQRDGFALFGWTFSILDVWAILITLATLKNCWSMAQATWNDLSTGK